MEEDIVAKVDMEVKGVMGTERDHTTKRLFMLIHFQLPEDVLMDGCRTVERATSTAERS